VPGVVDEPGTVDGDAAPGAAEVGRPEEPKATRPQLRFAGRLVAFSVLVLGVGALAGVVWWAMVEPPAYRVNPDGGASISERGLTEFLGGDAYFCAIGLVVGIAVGIGAWRWFDQIGWPLVLLVCGLAFLAGLTCWFVGYRLSPGEFSARLAAAQPGDLVPIDLTLRARASLLVWPFCAVIPVLLGSSLGRDDEEPHPLFRRRAAASSGTGQPES
jgi:hypothetical protein